MSCHVVRVIGRGFGGGDDREDAVKVVTSSIG